VKRGRIRAWLGGTRESSQRSLRPSRRLARPSSSPRALFNQRIEEKRVLVNDDGRSGLRWAWANAVRA
jgi:hypothetical protein